MKLIKGKIPKGTDCPFKDQCETKAKGFCHHLGVNHPVNFSCGTARLFDIMGTTENKELPCTKV